MLAKNELDESLHYLNKAIELYPSGMHAYFHKAKCLKKLKKEEELLFCLKQTLLAQLSLCNTLKRGKIRLCLYRAINECTLDILKNNYLWFSKRSQLNDPLDCLFYERIADEDMLEIIRSVRIRSLSVCDSEYNALLWAHYADGARGIMIEYEFDIETLIKNNIFINQVEYSDCLRPQKTMPEFIDYGKSYFNKTISWQVEKEWRLVTPAENLKDEHKLTNMFKIKNITFGLAAKDEDKKLIQSIVKDCKFYELVCGEILSGESAIKRIPLN